MHFSELAIYLEKLEKTASRNEMTKILAEVLKKAKAEEIDKICYLLLGELLPAYRGVEFNIAEKMMIQIIAQAYARPAQEAARLYKSRGDMGDAVYELAVKSRSLTGKKRLMINDVYQKMTAIAEESGEGSQERKVKSFAGLLSLLDPLSAKFVARIPVAKLRLGFSEATLLDAFSLMEAGDKSARPMIEQAYNVTADIGFIAKRIKAEGLEGLKRVQPKPGVPIRASLAERLKSIQEAIEKAGPIVAVEQKLDGFRCVTGYTGVYVRNKGYTAIREVKAGDLVLTHRGRYRKVVAVNKRTIEKKERLFKLQSYLGNEFRITEGHKILAWKNGKMQWLPVENVSTGDELIFPVPQVSLLGRTGNFLPNPHLTLQDSSGYTKTISAANDFYRLLGFWIGDGFTNDFHNTERVGLLFNAVKERGLADEYLKIIKGTLSAPQISESKWSGVLSVYWRDKPFREWLSQYFRRDWRGKMLPQWFWGIGRKRFLSFLRGYIESDGASMHGGGFKIVTKEQDLAAFVQLLGLRHKKIIGLRRIRSKIIKNNFSGTYYQLIVPGTERRARVLGNKILVRVLRKEAIRPDPRTRLYNLQVEGDESYCTSMAALHNCQIHKFTDKNQTRVSIFSRNLENTTFMFPEIAASARQLPVKSAILDGETIGYNPKTGKFRPFQETVQRKRKYQIEEFAKKIPLSVFVFDILYLDGRSLLGLPFQERRKILERTLDRRDYGAIRLAEQHTTNDPQVIGRDFKKSIEAGLEGLVLKNLKQSYQAGSRGFHWIKLKATSAALEKLREAGVKSSKLPDTVDCVVMAAFRGRGKRATFGFGGFLLGIGGPGDRYYTITRLGTGLSDEQFREAQKRVNDLKVSELPKQYVVDKDMTPDIWLKPSLVVEILADEITLSPRHTAGRKEEGRGYSLRFPRLVRFRDDKKPEDATTISEIRKMYRGQRQIIIERI